MILAWLREDPKVWLEGSEISENRRARGSALGEGTVYRVYPIPGYWFRFPTNLAFRPYQSLNTYKNRLV